MPGLFDWILKIYRKLFPKKKEEEPPKIVVPMKLPLGGSVDGKVDPGLFKVYVPTRDRGKMKVKTSGGTVSVCFPDENTPYKDKEDKAIKGSEVEFDIKEGDFGWFYLHVQGSTGYKIENQFWQEGISKDKDDEKLIPWNFWYWPWSPQGAKPHAWDDPGPCTKFDKQFECESFKWEEQIIPVGHKTEDKEGTGWFGHCDAAAAASMYYKQPNTAEVPDGNKQGYMEHELELLVTEYAMSHYDFGWDWSLEHPRSHPDQQIKPKKGGEDPLDKYASGFHKTIVELIGKHGLPLLMDMRDSRGNNAAAVWNQAVYKFKAEFKENPDAKGSEEEKAKNVHIKNVFTANEDVHYRDNRSNKDPETGPKRQQETEYILIYKDDGRIHDKHPDQDWITVKLEGTELHPPRYMCYLQGMGGFSGRGNPHMTEGRIKALGIKPRDRYAGGSVRV